MKILQVVQGFPPESRAGTELYTYSLAKELSRRHEVHVFHPSTTSRTKEYSVNKCDGDSLNLVEHVGREAKGQLPLAGLMARANLKHTYINTSIHRDFEMVLDETEPHIVHFQHLINLSASLIELAKEKGFPAILTLHDFWFICPMINLLKSDYSVCDGPYTESNNCRICWVKDSAEHLTESWARYRIPKRLSGLLELGLMAFRRNRDLKERQEYLKSLLLKADKLIAPSRFLRNIFVQYGIPGDRIIYSSNGYDLSAFEGFKSKKHDKLVFGFAGAVAKHKGVHVLVDAFNKVESEDVELRIYGNYDPKSNYFKELQSMIRNDNIKFMGRYTDVREPYSEMDVLVVPSICYESYSLVVREAFICKIPVIASDIGALPEAVQNGETGLLFQAGNARDLYEKMELIIHHPDLIEKFKTNIGPVKSIEQQAEEMEGIYLDLLMSKHE